MMHARLNFFLSFLGLFLLFSCSSEDPRQYKSVQGKLDLRAIDFEKSNYISLEGEWEFYWQELIQPNQATARKKMLEYIQVPGSWTNQKTEKQKKYCSAYGYATYRLEIQLPEDHPSLALFIPKIWSATRVWVNDKEYHHSGKVADNYANYQNRILEKLVILDNVNTQLNITVQVANHDMFIAGLIQNFKLGAAQKLQEATTLSYSWTLMWLGALLVMGLYHLILFGFRSQRTSTLFFGLICLLVGIRLIIFGDHYLYEYLKAHAPWFNFKVQSTLYYANTFALGPLGLAYIRSLYPKRILKVILQISIGLTSVYLLFIIFSPPRVYMPTVTYYNGLFFPMLLYVFVAIVIAAWKRREESAWLALGLVILIFAGISDALHQVGFEILGYLELFPLAFPIFLSVQFIVLAKRFSRAFREVEDLSSNLEKKVEKRTAELHHKNQEIEEKNDRLELAYKHIKDSMIYASRIQKSILISEQEVIESFQDAFVILAPKDIVSGDFYWHANIIPNLENNQEELAHWEGEEIQLLVAADCTGHGVPGAFMTVMGNDFLNEIILEKRICNPAKILHELDERVQQTLQKKYADRQTPDGMDITIIALNKSRGEILFSGAKNPIYYVRDGNMHVFNGNKFPIGGNSYYKEKIFENQIITPKPGDKIYLFSDGFQDQFGGESGRKFMKKRFRETLLEVSEQALSQQKQRLLDILSEWQGDQPRTDDILVIGIEI